MTPFIRKWREVERLGILSLTLPVPYTPCPLHSYVHAGSGWTARASPGKEVVQKHDRNPGPAGRSGAAAPAEDAGEHDAGPEVIAEARRVAAAILEVLAGGRTPAQAATALSLEPENELRPFLHPSSFLHPTSTVSSYPPPIVFKLEDKVLRLNGKINMSPFGEVDLEGDWKPVSDTEKP